MPDCSSTLAWLNLGVLLGTGLVVAWYTVETSRLRREAQRQTELQTRPFISIARATEVTGNLIGPVFRLTNVGRGMARNVTLDPVRTADGSIELRAALLTHLQPGDSVIPLWRVSAAPPGGQLGELPATANHQATANTALATHDFVLVVRYASIVGQGYRTRIRLRQDVAEIIDDERVTDPAAEEGVFHDRRAGQEAPNRTVTPELWWDKSLYLGLFVRVLDVTKWLSLNHWLVTVVRCCVRRRHGGDSQLKLLSEGYQLVFLGAVPFLWALLFWAPGTAPVIVGIAIYRMWDIFTFALRWAIVDRGAPLISKTRSLMGFLLNLVEVVLYFAIAGVGLGCLTEVVARLTPLAQIMAVTYSSLRTAMTIGPSSHVALEPPHGRHGCGLLLMSEVAVAFFLTVVVIASLLDAIRRRE